MKTAHRMTLNTIRRTTTPEYLGTEATTADVESYLDLLASRWPVENADELVADETADLTQTRTFDAWCKGVRGPEFRARVVALSVEVAALFANPTRPVTLEPAITRALLAGAAPSADALFDAVRTEALS